MKIVVALLITGVLVLLVYVLLAERYSAAQANRVSATLSTIAEDRNESLRRSMMRYRHFIKSCLPFFAERKDVRLRVKEGERFLVFLDSALVALQTLKGHAHDRDQADLSYQQYKALVNRHAHLLDAQPALFNEYLHLDQQLLPEEIAVESRNAVEISAIILEESLLTAVERKLDKTVGEISGEECPETH